MELFSYGVEVKGLLLLLFAKQAIFRVKFSCGMVTMSKAAMGWTKVAQGAQKVLSAVVKQSTEEATIGAQRAAHHGLDLSTKARQTAVVVSEQFQNHPYRGGGNLVTTSMTTQIPTPPNSSQNSTTNINHAASATMSRDQSVVDDVRTIPNPYLIHEEHQQSTIHDSNERKEKQSIKSDDEEEEEENIRRQENRVSSATIHKTSINDTNIKNEGPKSAEIGQRLQEGRAVPSSRFGRAVGFATLGAGLVLGTATEAASRLLGGGSGDSGNVVTSNDANADRLAATLCRMRGAALKMGQMLSIQDETLLPPALTRALKQVRQGADAMPEYQLVAQLESQLGTDWRSKFETFDMLPFAAASIGQVHHATIRDNKDDQIIHNVVVKVQYPGVAQSIESDLRNLTMLIKMTGMAPKGLFLDNVIRVGRDELKEECNYLNEMANQQMFQNLVDNDPVLQANEFVVPRVYEDLTTEQVIVTEYASGGTIDKVSFLSQEERNRIGRTILYLTMKELFEWRIMQTDPNWGNFLYDVGTNTTTLIDFGATKEYSKEFVDGYLRIVWANANQDEDTLMDMSHKMGFLTGDENPQMLNAHKLSGFTVGEPFWVDEPFDFQGSQISSRMSEHTSVFLRHRLT